MKKFYFDTDTKLREILAENEELGAAQYEELTEQFIYLICDYQEDEPQEEIERRTGYIRAIIEFLYNTKELTLKEHMELGELLEQIMEEAKHGQT